MHTTRTPASLLLLLPNEFQGRILRTLRLARVEEGGKGEEAGKLGGKEGSEKVVRKVGENGIDAPEYGINGRNG